MSRLGSIRTFVDECVVEMQRVTWPDRGQLRNATWVVILFTILISIVIWIMDQASKLVLVDFIMGVFTS